MEDYPPSPDFRQFPEFPGSVHQLTFNQDVHPLLQVGTAYLHQIFTIGANPYPRRSRDGSSVRSYRERTGEGISSGLAEVDTFTDVPRNDDDVNALHPESALAIRTTSEPRQHTTAASAS